MAIVPISVVGAVSGVPGSGGLLYTYPYVSCEFRMKGSSKDKEESSQTGNLLGEVRCERMWITYSHYNPSKSRTMEVVLIDENMPLLKFVDVTIYVRWNAMVC
ncbi:hypothetical protein PHJA_002936000 [Phtheirospermum japonicum]|uniref:Uncharacterized protein n=1 Tax=Phtheirospermum japonicum TaxID=374723 RepID=A0A830D9J4_9LAMI|nr:hypothetical protein PHJA_002936000 [Phtheirospermum japonicum]